MHKENQWIVKTYLEHYNKKNVDAMVDLFSEEAVFESVSNHGGNIRTENREQLRNLAQTSAAYFAERRQTPLSWVIQENRLALEIEYWCRLAKDLPDGKKAGEELRLRGASFFTVENGRIIYLADYM